MSLLVSATNSIRSFLQTHDAAARNPDDIQLENTELHRIANLRWILSIIDDEPKLFIMMESSKNRMILGLIIAFVSFCIGYSLR